MVPHRPASFLVWDTCTIVTATVLYLYSSLHNSHVKTWSSVGWSWKVGLFSVDSALIERTQGTSLLHFTTWRGRKVPFVNQGIASTRHCPELKWLVCAIIYANVCTMMKLSKGTFLRMAPHLKHHMIQVWVFSGAGAGQTLSISRLPRCPYLHDRGLLSRCLGTHWLNPDLLWLAVTPGFNGVSPHREVYCLTKPVVLFC